MKFWNRSLKITAIVSLAFGGWCTAATETDDAAMFRAMVQAAETEIFNLCTQNPDRTLKQSLKAYCANPDTANLTPPQINLPLSLARVLADLTYLQRKKLKYRNTPNHLSPYVTAYLSPFNQGAESDPYHITYVSGDGDMQRKYKYSMNYDGAGNSRQPGNFFLRQCEPVWDAVSYPFGGDNAYPEKERFFTPAYQLLLMGEICRRKAVDPYRHDESGDPLRDVFHELPVAVGITVADLRIREADAAQYNTFMLRFWPQGGAYHFFSGFGNMRADACDLLIRRFRESNPAFANLQTCRTALIGHAALMFGFTVAPQAAPALPAPAANPLPPVTAAPVADDADLAQGMAGLNLGAQPAAEQAQTAEAQAQSEE